MLSEAISFPTEDDDLARPYLIGSGLLLGSFFIGITVIPLYGYYLQVIDAGRTGTSGLPAFEDWETLLKDGVKMFVVNLAYSGVPGMIFFTAMFFSFFVVGFGALSESGAVMAIALVIAGLITLLTGVLWLIGSLLGPAALAHMRAEDEFQAAFQVRTIASIAATSDYIVALLLAMFVGGTITMIGALFSILLVGLPVMFFGGMVTFHLYGQAYQQARDRKLGPRGGAAPQAEPV